MLSKRIIATAGLALQVATCFLALAGQALADELQFVPLQTYLVQPNIADDPVAVAYVANRCSALYTVFAKGLEGETDPARQQGMAQAVAAGEKFMTIATKATMTGTTMDFAGALARIRTTVVALANLYQERIERARNLTGDMFSDPLIAGDLQVCKTMLAQI